MAQTHVLLALSGVLLLAVGWWVLVRQAPEGGFTTTLASFGYQYGVTRRQMIPAAVVASFMFLPLVRHGTDGLSLLYVVSAGAFGGGVLSGAISLANRHRERLLRNANCAEEAPPKDGSCVIAGKAKASAESGPLTSPVTRRDAVCYTAFVAQPGEASSGEFRAYFTTDFVTGRAPFEVDGPSGSVTVDPAGAWLSFAPGGPTDAGFRIEGVFTGGPAEHEVVVEAGETVPGHLWTEGSPFSGALPVADDGTATRDIRFKENVIEPGEDVVVAGDAEPGREFGTTHVTCESRVSFVARGDYEQVASSLRRVMRGNLVYSATLTIAGGVGIVLLTF